MAYHHTAGIRYQFIHHFPIPEGWTTGNQIYGNNARHGHSWNDMKTRYLSLIWKGFYPQHKYWQFTAFLFVRGDQRRERVHFTSDALLQIFVCARVYGIWGETARKPQLGMETNTKNLYSCTEYLGEMWGKQVLHLLPTENLTSLCSSTSATLKLNLNR